MNRWSKSGVLDRVFEELQQAQVVRIKLEAVSLDSTIVKVHPDGTGALKKTARNQSVNRAEAGPPRFIKVAAHARCALSFALSQRTRGRCPARTRIAPGVGSGAHGGLPI